jgi:hypothetical protein
MRLDYLDHAAREVLKERVEHAPHARIGAGHNGIVYSTAHTDVVLKVTTDLAEARVAAALKGSPLPGVPVTHEVQQLEWARKRRAVRFWAIWREDIEPAHGVDEAVARPAPLLSSIRLLSSYIHGAYMQRRRALGLPRVHALLAEPLYDAAVADVRRREPMLFDRVRAEIADLQQTPFAELHTTFDALLDRGLLLGDAQPKNIGRRRGTGALVVFDLGGAVALDSQWLRAPFSRRAS